MSSSFSRNSKDILVAILHLRGFDLFCTQLFEDEHGTSYRSPIKKLKRRESGRFLGYFTVGKQEGIDVAVPLSQLLAAQSLQCDLQSSVSSLSSVTHRMVRGGG